MKFRFHSTTDYSCSKHWRKKTIQGKIIDTHSRKLPSANLSVWHLQHVKSQRNSWRPLTVLRGQVCACACVCVFLTCFCFTRLFRRVWYYLAKGVPFVLACRIVTELDSAAHSTFTCPPSLRCALSLFCLPGSALEADGRTSMYKKQFALRKPTV